MSIQNPTIAERVLCPLDDTAASPSVQFGGPTNTLSGTGLRGDIASITASIEGVDKLTITADGVSPLIASAPPLTAADPGVAGTITWDASFLYVCIATDTWVRTALTTW